MLHVQSFTNVKFITTLLLVFILVGCGGGDGATTTSTSTTSTSTDTTTVTDTTSNTTGSATLKWVAPTTYTDDSAITLGGHNIYIDDGKGYTKLVSINNPSISTYIVENLSPGTYSFVVTAFDSDGDESAYSNSASMTISS